jgi:hypothetical protein
VRLDDLTAVIMKSTIFQGVMPCSLVEIAIFIFRVEECSLDTYLLGLLLNHEDGEKVLSSGASANFYQTTWHHIPEGLLIRHFTGDYN